MMYDAYQNYADLSQPVRLLAASSGRTLNALGATHFASPLRRMAAYLELVQLAGFTHKRPDYGIKSVTSANGDSVAVTEEVVLSTPFANLLRFARQDRPNVPKVLMVAPMSGHFATLLRNTVRTMLRDFEVYITDWINPRDIPLEAGIFGFDEYVEHVIDFLRHIGPQAHLVAVCQPTVAALVATAVMAQQRDEMQPASMTLMAGPIDTRVSPTKVNELATSKPIEWFREKMIGVVPRGLPGAGRRVYPGFVQLAAFMSMNVERHVKSFLDLYKARVAGDTAKADQIRTFYEEYFAIMDLDAEFYLQTVETIFQKYALPRGQLKFKGELVQPRAIKRTFLLTIEGERDDICAVGQTLAAQDLCSGLRPYMKSHYMQSGVGHYGVFSGRMWENRIYPVVRDHIQYSL
jgi:poly(3-hydroxybutyrate) depolymerase